jgi:hypothetical protein
MDSTPQQPQPQDDWLLSPTTPTSETPQPTEVLDSAAPVQATDVTPRQGRSQLLGAGGLVAAGLVAGAVGTFALGHHGSSTSTFPPAASNAQQVPGGTVQGGPMGGFGGPPPGLGGGMAGEEHVQGTVAGVSGSTLKVTTGSGTTSYTISSSTQVLRDGRAATLSQLESGDPVVVHVITSNGSTLVERVIAGTLSQGGFPGGPAAGQSST